MDKLTAKTFKKEQPRDDKLRLKVCCVTIRWTRAADVNS